MSTTVSADISSRVQARFQSSTDLSTTFTGSPLIDFDRTFATTELTKCYFNYSVTTTPTSVDLTALTDAYGAALSFATVRQLIVVHTDTTNSLTVGGDNGLFSALPVLTAYTATAGDDGSCVNLTTNITVDGSHKILTLTAGAGTVSVDVIVLGV